MWIEEEVQEVLWLEKEIKINIIAKNFQKYFNEQSTIIVRIKNKPLHSFMPKQIAQYVFTFH